MFSTHQKGEIGKLKVQTRATELGYTVSIPAVESRYDLVLDDGKQLLRVQVKYSDEVIGGAVAVGLKTECRNSGYRRNYEAGEIDVVIAYLPATGKCYWLTPKEFAGVGSVALRLEPAKNNQKKGVRLAKDFEW